MDYILKSDGTGTGTVTESPTSTTIVVDLKLDSEIDPKKHHGNRYEYMILDDINAPEPEQSKAKRVDLREWVRIKQPHLNRNRGISRKMR